ncbi:MAG: hypothetical protein ABJC19_09760 [Gemmatimonadota bacterium]
MNYPIRYTLLAAVLLAPFAFGPGISGAPALLLRVLDVFFAVSFVLLLLLHLFFNRKWRIDPGPQWQPPMSRRAQHRLAHPRAR